MFQKYGKGLQQSERISSTDICPLRGCAVTALKCIQKAAYRASPFSVACCCFSCSRCDLLTGKPGCLLAAFLPRTRLLRQSCNFTTLLHTPSVPCNYMLTAWMPTQLWHCHHDRTPSCYLCMALLFAAGTQALRNACPGLCGDSMNLATGLVLMGCRL